MKNICRLTLKNYCCKFDRLRKFEDSFAICWWIVKVKINGLNLWHTRNFFPEILVKKIMITSGDFVCKVIVYLNPLNTCDGTIDPFLWEKSTWRSWSLESGFDRIRQWGWFLLFQAKWPFRSCSYLASS